MKNNLSLCFLPYSLLHQAHFSSVVLAYIHMVWQPVCGVEIITEQASVPLPRNIDTSKTWALFATAPGTIPANMKRSVSLDA